MPSLPNPTTWPHNLATPPASTSPYFFSNSGVDSFTSHMNRSVKVLWDRTIFLPYPRRQNNLTICRCHYKGSTKSSQFFIDPECCSGQGLNLRPPTQPTSTLPTELTRWQFIFPPYQSNFCHFFFQISLKMEIIWKVHSKYKTTKQCLYLPHRSFLQLSYTHPIHL